MIQRRRKPGAQRKKSSRVDTVAVARLPQASACGTQRMRSSAVAIALACGSPSRAHLMHLSDVHPAGIVSGTSVAARHIILLVSAHSLGKMLRSSLACCRQILSAGAGEELADMGCRGHQS